MLSDYQLQKKSKFTLDDLREETISFLMDSMAMGELPPKDAINLLSILTKEPPTKEQEPSSLNQLEPGSVKQLPPVVEITPYYGP